ncbi:hypothetical protein TNCT_213451 [Trichonephila clavata]|uniref:Uncharacterized protein n=1 Tax=Trichonephila clavata TaxID=2740835 RepID=A0A8X6IDJ2_TRICU|nr:hypothetical protein TNCT_213451 [Trichonephila clavata]
MQEYRQIRTRLVKDLIDDELKNPSNDPAVGQEYQTEMKSNEDSRKLIICELTRLISCPVKDCLHNTIVKALCRRLAAGSVSKPATPNLKNTKNKIKDQYSL